MGKYYMLKNKNGDEKKCSRSRMKYSNMEKNYLI